MGPTHDAASPAPVPTAAELAADPLTWPHVLARIAAEEPLLRPVVARNPAAYPGLLDWLAGLGDPAVDAALRERALVPAAPHPVPAGAGPFAVPAPGPFPAAPGAGPYGAPTGTDAYPRPFGYPGGASAGGGRAPRRRRPVLWVALGVGGVAVLVALLVGAGALLGPLAPWTAGYGDDPELDVLWDACAAEDWAACDDLYAESPPLSAYEEFGETCGERTDGRLACVEELGAGWPLGYGDDPALDALWDACAAGEPDACDRLYREAPVGSEYETFGDTCGGTAAGGQWCGERPPDGDHVGS